MGFPGLARQAWLHPLRAQRISPVKGWTYTMQASLRKKTSAKQARTCYVTPHFPVVFFGNCNETSTREKSKRHHQTVVSSSKVAELSNLKSALCQPQYMREAVKVLFVNLSTLHQVRIIRMHKIQQEKGWYWIE